MQRYFLQYGEMNLDIDPLISPCIKVCRLDMNKLCAGCFRTMDEITTWTQSDRATREAILLRTEHRRQQYRMMSDQ